MSKKNNRTKFIAAFFLVSHLSVFGKLENLPRTSYYMVLGRFKANIIPAMTGGSVVDHSQPVIEHVNKGFLWCCLRTLYIGTGCSRKKERNDLVLSRT